MVIFCVTMNQHVLYTGYVYLSPGKRISQSRVITAVAANLLCGVHRRTTQTMASTLCLLERVTSHGWDTLTSTTAQSKFIYSFLIDNMFTFFATANGGCNLSNFILDIMSSGPVKTLYTFLPCSIKHCLNFSGKHPAMLQIMHEGWSYNIHHCL